jgi:hypothetical protein
MNNLLTCLFSVLRTSATLFAISMTTYAQFREIGPAPFPPAEAHRKIRILLDQVDAANQQQTVKTIIGWLDWYCGVDARQKIQPEICDGRTGRFASRV